jgi:hypothetical protein
MVKARRWTRVIRTSWVPVTDHLVCDRGQVTLLRLTRPLNET